MIGFIKKDLAMIKSNFKLLGILIIVYTVMGFMGEMDISFILPFMSVMIMISTFSYDNYNKWDAYAISLPDGRKNSVKAKYVATIVMVLVIAIITVILSMLIAYFNAKTINYEQILFSMLGTVFGTSLVLTFMYPIIYKFGLEKARIGIFLIVFGTVIIGGFLLQYIDISSFIKKLAFLEDYLALILIVFIILMVYISYKISEKIFMKKEF